MPRATFLRITLSGPLFFLAAALAAWLLATTPSQAVEYPWCAEYGAKAGGAIVCGFTTQEQCLASVSGVGGFCRRNYAYTEPAAPSARKPRKSKSN